MKIEDAVIQRIEELKVKYNFTQYELAEKSGVPQTTLVSIKKKRSKNIGIINIHKICNAFNMELIDFFDSPLFSDLDNSDY